MTDAMPTIGIHRGVPLHDFQDNDRIDDVVKPAIDAVHANNDRGWLYEHAVSFRNPAESRLFAAAKVRAMFELRASSHESRQGVDLEVLAASVVGLDSLTWTDPDFYIGLCDPGGRAPGTRNTIERRPEHYRQRFEEAREQAREWVRTHRRAVPVED